MARRGNDSVERSDVVFTPGSADGSARRVGESGRWSCRSRLAVGVDSVMAAAVAAFAWWTILREVDLVSGSSTTPFVIAWLVTAPVVMIPIARWNRRVAAHPGPHRSSVVAEGPLDELASTSRSAVLAIVVCAGAAAVVLATAKGVVLYLGWVLGLLALGLAGRALRAGAGWADVASPGFAATPVATRSTGTGAGTRVRLEDAAAALLAAVIAVGSLFAVQTSSDDAYYVNAATWTAEHGTIPLRDTMYGPEVYPSAYGGGYPLRSIETLFGALARLVHLQAGTVAYLIAAPVCTFALVWVLWQLAAVSMRRRAFPAFLFSVAFIVAGTGGTWRTYSARIWDGKSIAVAVLMPLIWIFAIRLARSRDRHWTVLLFLAGISFVGLTSSASLLGMAMAAIVVVAGVLRRNHALIRGGVALALAPLASGVVIALAGSVGGPNPRTPTPWSAVHEAYGAHPVMVALTISAILLSPLVLRRSAAVLVWASGLAFFAVLAPGVLALANASTRSGPVEWRLLLAAPVPTLIGACAVTVIAVMAHAVGGGARARHATTAVAAAVTLVGFALAGTPLWVSGPIWQPRPSWNVNPTHLANVRALLHSGPKTTGPVLMPPGEMRALAISTTEVFAVVPREFDLSNLQEAPAQTAARRLLLAFVTARHATPSAAAVSAALDLLHVKTVCLRPNAATERQIIRRAGFATEQPIGALVCSTRTQ